MSHKNLAFENVKILLAQKPDLLFFPSPKNLAVQAEILATNNLTVLEKMNEAFPHAVWLVRCSPEFELICIEFPRARDRIHTSNDYGELPTTLEITRGDWSCCWFVCDKNDDIKMDARLAATQAKLKRNAVLPGSIHPTSGEPYLIGDGSPLDLGRMVRLPASWSDRLPRNRAGITAKITERHEWQPQVRDEDFARRSWKD